ncbi:electron transfer flavoprotein subunit alpha/FixB family protein [Aestuariibacter sp. A3R04]|uniref:electron transfer flavoprotein subunit alpha/FixB family protein n=1 Tax=Aestuariibacter sp. A3R04 TaxID=2841571 RepID=UPI001C09A509|nr:FAD-binding protein [Aestuariibacter sp. A3R04]MBU3022756.1 FAD-binding protein [Aestuariibacter sp. A3R04]
MSILIIAEHDNSQLKPETAKLAGAASKLNSDVHVLIVGDVSDDVVSKAAKLHGVSKVLVASHEVYAHQLAENTADLVVSVAQGYSHVLAAATTTGKNFMPRVAALLDVEQISDITDIAADNTFVRPIYAGNAIATVKSEETIHILTVRTSAFDAVPDDGSADIVQLDTVIPSAHSVFVSASLTESERPELTAADVIISGGRGMQSGDNFSLLEGIADKLGAAIGASRAAVDAGFVPNDMQVGQTGKIVAPQLYIAVGISGAIQHLAGMKDSKVIVAINKDEEAPIFQVADYGLVGDLFDILPQFEQAL